MTLQGDILEDPANEPKKDMYVMSVDPEDAPNTPECVIAFSWIFVQAGCSCRDVFASRGLYPSQLNKGFLVQVR